jgi:hypothetical protein
VIFADMSYNPYLQSNATPYIDVPETDSNPPGQLRSLYEPVMIPTSANRGMIKQMSLPTNNIIPKTISQIINPFQTSLFSNAE